MKEWRKPQSYQNIIWELKTQEHVDDNKEAEERKQKREANLQGEVDLDNEEALLENINQAIDTGETFSQLFYKKLDQDRHTIDKMYIEDATLAWNGNSVDGISNIKEYWLKLPKSSTYVQSLDAQPVHDCAVAGQTTVLVNVVRSHP